MAEAVTLESKEQEQGLFLQGIRGNCLRRSLKNKKTKRSTANLVIMQASLDFLAILNPIFLLQTVRIFLQATFWLLT